MAALTKTSIEAITDKVAAMAQAKINAHATMQSGHTIESLYKLLDALGDQDAEIALGSALNRCDESILTENAAYHTYQYGTGTSNDSLPTLKNAVLDAASKGVYSTLNSYINSENGGDTSFAAFLAAVGAYLHPVFAEIAYGANSAAFTSGGTSPNVYSPAYDTENAKAVYVGVPGTFIDKTVDAGDVGEGDFEYFTSNNDEIVIGHDRPFYLAIQNGTLANVDCGVEWYYSAGGSTYTQLTEGTNLTDYTDGMTKSGLIIPTITGWTRTNVDSGGNYFAATDLVPRYYLRMKRTTNTVGTPPVGTQISIIPDPVYDGTRLSGLVTQPPLAILRITAANTISVLTGSNLEANRVQFAAPGSLRLKCLAVQGTPAAISALTIPYTDQSGNADSKAQTINWTPSGSGDEEPSSAYLALNTSDTGVRQILAATWAITTTMTNCTLAVVNKIPRTPAL